MIRLWQLRHWALLTGKTMTGTRAQMEGHLIKSNTDPVLFSTPRKIVSIDMGIRNLAFCAVEVPPISRVPTDARTLQQTVKVSAWKKRDLLDDEATDPSGLVGAKLDFTPAIISKVAYQVVSSILEHQPDVILIEKQRFRSAGGAAIQEWTIRVNMLESMLWACLETLRAHPSFVTPRKFPATYAVDPARVARFWAAGPDVPLRPPPNLFTEPTLWRKVVEEASMSRKVTKKDRIAILRAWMAGDADVAFDFQGQAAEVSNVFQSTARRKKDVDTIGKLDDLCDCLLQAVAWARWQENQVHVQELWDSATKSP